jgi:hypothetical protein
MTDSASTFGWYSTGSLQGSFNALTFPTPQTDAWRANSGTATGAFTGNYWALTNFTGWQFMFFASNVLPSSLVVRFGDGTNVFSYAIGTAAMATGNWYAVSVPLTYSIIWKGGSAGQFSNALSSVNFIDIEVSRNGNKKQTYFIDNFSLTDQILFVPEPTSGLFWFGWALVFGGLRRRLAGRGPRSPYALPAATAAEPA